jgi:ferritin-like protein
MPASPSNKSEQSITRERLAELLNEDLSREYQAIIAYVVYSQVLKGAEYMSIADQLEAHAHDELKHALIISRQIDYLGKMPSVTPKPGGPPAIPGRCFVLISKMKMRPFANIAIACGNAKRWVSLPWRSKSGRF